MFFQLLYIHLFRPFLKYNPTTSPLPSHVSPRKLCTQAAGSVSKLMRLYKRTYGLRQICNIAVYIMHSACTIHLLNLPEKTAKRDIIHGAKHLEEIAEDWLCARRTLSILSVLARKWKIELPEEASAIFARTDAKYGTFSTADVPSPKADLVVTTPPSATSPPRPASKQTQQSPQPQLKNSSNQSLYSYLADPPSAAQNRQMNMTPMQTHQSQIRQAVSPVQNLKQDPSAGMGSMNMPNESLISTVPYTQYNTSAPASRSGFTPANDLPRPNSLAISESTSTRQVSPTAMFGGVDALVEKDWFLKDQASLAIGFDNWMGGDLNGGNPGANDVGNLVDMEGMAGTGTGFYMPSNNSNLDIGMNRYAEDDWNSYM